MSSFDELQRPLDANNNRIIGLGDPTTANDATKTDNSTGPSNPAAAASAGTSLKAAPSDHVHQGVHSVHADSNANLFGDVRLVSGSGIALTQSGQDITVAASGGTVNKITFGESDMTYVLGTVETILYEYYVDLDDAGSSGNIQVRLSAIVNVSAGTGTYKVYVGATSPGSTTGGTARATITTASTTSDVQTNLGSAFTNPTGGQLVQITAVNSGANKSHIRGFAVTIG
jgi:hypothetical protein